MPFSFHSRTALITTSVLALTIGVSVYCYTVFTAQAQTAKKKEAPCEHSLNETARDKKSSDTTTRNEKVASETVVEEARALDSEKNVDVKEQSEKSREEQTECKQSLQETATTNSKQEKTESANLLFSKHDDTPMSCDGAAKQRTDTKEESNEETQDAGVEVVKTGNEKVGETETLTSLGEAAAGVILAATVLTAETAKEVSVQDETQDRAVPDVPEVVPSTDSVDAAVQESTSEEKNPEPESRTATSGMEETNQEVKEEENASDRDIGEEEPVKESTPQAPVEVSSEVTGVDNEVKVETSEQSLVNDDVASTTFDTNDTVSPQDGAHVAPNDSKTPEPQQQQQSDQKSDAAPLTAAPGQNKIETTSTFNSSARTFTPVSLHKDGSSEKAAEYNFWSHPTFNIEHQPAPGPEESSQSSPFPQQRNGKQRLSRLEKIEQQRQGCPPKKKSRCQYWPACTNKNCKYSHPSKVCREGSRCTFGSRCMFLHDGDYNEPSKKKQHTQPARSSSSELTA